jgi:RNA polymerase sigma factor (sigma-70 family)
MDQNSNQARLLKVFRTQEAQLRGYLRRYVDSAHDIDDVCQETLTRSFEAAEDRPVENPGAFLYGIARNLVRRRFERKSRSLVDVIADFTPDDYESDEPDLDDIMIERERLTCYQAAIARLSPKTQRVFTLRKVYGYTHREIADMLDISIKTVENHITTGMKRCRENLINAEMLEKNDNVISITIPVKSTSKS